MKHRFVGRTGLKVSQLAFGTMSFGGDADEETARAMFARCRDAGINHFDCADMYAGGRSEEILGELVGPCRDEIVLATKAYFPTGDDVNARGSSRYHLVRAVEASLKRLGTDRIDLFYLHRHDDATAIDETLRALDDLVRQGKILYPAASNFAAWQAMKALEIARARGQQPIAALQPMYNLVKRQAESEILPMAAAEDLAVFPYSPVAGGLLSGKYGQGRKPETGRFLTNKAYQTRYGGDRYREAAEAFEAIAGELGHHPVSLAVAWVASHPAVTAPIIGARNTGQLEAALAATDIDMTDELRDRIGELWPAAPPATDRTEETTDNNLGAR